MVNASPELVWSFVALAILVAAAFVALVHRAAVNARRDSSRARRAARIGALALHLTSADDGPPHRARALPRGRDRRVSIRASPGDACTARRAHWCAGL